MQGRATGLAGVRFNNQPLVLDGKHPITRLVVEDYHKKTNHYGDETVVNELRQQYWITNLQAAVRSVITKCQSCRVRRAKPKPPLMVSLPSARMAHHQPPFSHCGMDYFGPMWVTVGRRREKRWGVLFTCLTTRAIHLDTASSLTTDSAIMAIRRLAGGGPAGTAIGHVFRQRNKPPRGGQRTLRPCAGD